MNEHDSAKAAIILWHSGGGAIQCRYKIPNGWHTPEGLSTEWRPCRNPKWNFEQMEYRRTFINPPRDRWLVNNGLLETPFDSLHEATAMAALCEGYVTHYREVV